MTADRDLIIRKADQEDEAVWDQFVAGNSSATFFHRYRWSHVLAESFGHTPHYLMAIRSGRVAGILPLIHKTSALFGNALISLPFLSYGGIVAEDEASAQALEDHALTLAEVLHVDYIEFRNIISDRPDWTRDDRTYAGFSRVIPPGRDAIIRSVPGKGRRHALRKSLAAGLTFGIQDDLDDFYRVLSESYRNLGTPIFPKRYFERIIESFAGEFEIYVVRGPNGPLATALAFAFRDHVHPFYAGGTKTARDLRANDFLFLNMMCRAREIGYERFDFGRSKVGTGSFAYKTHWGFEPKALNYEYRLVRGRKLPDLTPLNPRLSPYIEMWKRLPLSISRLVGPHLVRHLG